MDRRDFLYRAAIAPAAGAFALNRAAAQTSAPARPKVRVGVLGAVHSHVPGKLSGLLALRDDFELVGIVESNAIARERLSGNPKFKDIRWIDESELLGTSGLQAVLVESSVPELQPLAARCIKAGLHVHLEKPGGTDHAEFTGLLAAAKQHRVHVQLGYMLRYNPAFEFCLEAVRQGWLGPITESVGIMSKDADEQGRRELLSYPGGAMFELGCHLIDALIAMLGAPQRVSPFDRRSSAKQDALIDNQLAVIEYPSATATIRCSLVDPANNKRRQFYLGGEQGAIEIYPLEPPHLKLTLKRSVGGYDAGEHQVELPKVDGRYTAQLADFAAVVRGERPPRYSAEHDLAVHKALLAASNLKVT